MLFVLRHYSLPVVLAFALHASLVLFLWQGLSNAAPEERIIQPRVINSTLLVLEPSPSKARPKAPPPPTQPEAQPEAVKPDKVDPRLLEDQRRQRDEARKKTIALENAKIKKAQEEQERLAKEELRRQRAQAEADRAARVKKAAERAAKERQERLDALATSSAAQNAQAQEQAEGEELALAQSFFQGIRAKIVANWSRPASARNGMKVTLRVELVPSGEVAAVSLVESSGDTAFDRSAESAVRRAGGFAVPDDSAVFERRFRRFNLLFNPEDLLR